MSKTLVVIPYCKEGAQGRELEYAMAGWRRHFREDFTLVLVGDYAPGADIFIDCPRIEHKDDGNYIPHLDHVNKFMTVLGLFQDAPGFIYACDDMYAVKDFTLDDVKRLKCLEGDLYGSMLSTNGWDRDEAKTRNILVQAGLPTRNFVCHLPVYYDRQMLLAIYDKYDCARNSCIVEDVYFNTYYPDADADHADKWRLGLDGKKVTTSQIEAAIGDKTWIVNSPLGWSKKLDSVLSKYYGE